MKTEFEKELERLATEVNAYETKDLVYYADLMAEMRGMKNGRELTLKEVFERLVQWQKSKKKCIATDCEGSGYLGECPYHYALEIIRNDFKKEFSANALRSERVEKEQKDETCS